MNTRTNPENPTAKLKPALDAAFKFQVGDVIATIEQLKADEAELEINKGNAPAGKYSQATFNPPLPLTIVSRLVEECHGGVQLMYMVQGREHNGGQVNIRLFEYAIVDYADAVAARRALRDSRNTNSSDTEFE